MCSHNTLPPSLSEHFPHCIVIAPLLSEFCSRSVIFKHKSALESPVELAKTQIAGPYPQSFQFSNPLGERGASDVHF